MTNNDNIANALSSILNSERRGKSELIIRPATRLLKQIAEIMKREGYIKDYNLLEGRGNLLRIELGGRLNKCGAIKPRFSIMIDEYDKFERRYLPAKDFGILIVSTSKGLMTHKEAKEKNIGGRLIAYIY